MNQKLNPQEAKALAHWASFGQPGRPSSQRATASAWKTKPFQKPERAAWRVPISAEKLGALLNGFCPKQMEDKWFVYADGPDDQGHARLHMYRSWTGFKVAELEIEVTTSGGADAGPRKAQITAITFETDTDRIKDQTEESAKDQALQVCEWVLLVKLKEDPS